MKFINKYTKVVLETNSEFVIEQIKKSNEYEEFKEKVVVKSDEIEDKPKKKKLDKEEI